MEHFFIMKDNNPTEDLIIGRGAVIELLNSASAVECIYLQKNVVGTAKRIEAMARGNGILVKYTDIAKLNAMCENNNHQGVVAKISAGFYSSIEDIFNKAKENNAPPFIIIADEIEDPHNLGAIIRTAEAAGAHGIIIPKRRSAGLTMTVSKTSAGAFVHMPIVKVSNLVTVIQELKKKNVWVYAADFGGEIYNKIDYTGAVALIIGAEGKGVARLVKEKSDFVVTLPMYGKMNSLNASVAAGIVMYEIAKQRNI